MVFFRRLTETDLTPGRAPTALSTLAEQAAQLMPVTMKLSLANVGSSPQGAGRSHSRPSEITWRVIDG
jgi:hypothetical protein